jgi:fibronectin type 3 domain-containing protein
MKKLYTFLLLSVSAFQIYAQAPVLPIKTDLATTLSGSKTFSDGVNPDVISFPLSSPTEFTLEIKAKINAAQGRGLDVEVKNSYGVGLRTSLDKTTFNNSTALPLISNLSTSVDNAQEQTYRYAVKDGVANIYQDGHYLGSKALDLVTDPSGTSQIVYGSDNLMGRWAGVAGDNSGKPTVYGWTNTVATLPWNTANSTSGVRYVDVTTGHTFESDGTAYKGRIMYMRWDNASYSASTYSYPIKLEKGLQYEFSWIYEYVANAAAGAKINVAISAGTDGSGAISSKSFTTGAANKLRKGDLTFTSEVEGTYYVTFTGAYALFGIGDLKLKSSNLINTWDGFVNNNSGTPAVYGWVNSSSTAIFTAANTATGTRYMDVITGHTFESDGSTYSGKLMYIGWDDATVQNSTYSFPVQLEASKDYKFSWIYDYISNLSPGSQMTVKVNTLADGTGTEIASKSFVTGAANALRKGDLSFSAQNAGTYYVTMTGDQAVFGIGELKVQKEQVARINIGKNYAAGTVDMVLSLVTYEDKAYAPEKIIAPSAQTLETTTDLNLSAFAKSNVVLKGSASLYLKNAYNPLINSTVDLNTTTASLYFENIKPTQVIDSYLKFIVVNGVPASNGVNVSVSMYGSGAVVAPYSAVDIALPLEVYTEENFGGTAQQYAAVTPHASLGSFDNTIKSFKLKKGYMATFATNADGLGYSRVFIAPTQDLEIPVLSAYLNGTISFIRTMKWNEVSKKGLANGSNEVLAATNSTWFYNWNTGLDTTPSVEYVPIRQSNGWPSFTPAYTKEGYTHLLGFNEPDRPDQANMTVEAAISSWPDLLKSGLRVGSPATSDPFNPWMGTFMAQAEAKNYRIDYMALHCYWYKSAAQWKSDLQNIFDRYHRPIWITEWNVGANWTGNSFPDGPVMLTDANATKHKNDLAGVLDVLETIDYVERYSLYNWVQDSRALYVTINDAFKTRNPDWESYVWLNTAPVISSTATEYVVLTPAGEYYAKNASAKAYNPAREYISTWKTLVENLSYKLSSDFNNAAITWTGNNQELVNRYTVERRLEGEVDFSVFYDSTNSTVLSVNDVVHSKAEYRLKVVGIDNVETVSPVITIIKAVVPDAPSGLSGEAISTTIINLNWPAADRAEAYNIWRANSIDGSYALIASYLAGTSFQDTGLNKNTSYYYTITALNTGGESPKSTPLTVSTLDLVVPQKVSNVVLASGDAKVKLEWSNMYDAEFYVKRSTSESGPFTTIATTQSGNYVDLTALNGTTYYYKVAAFNSAGEGTESEVIISRPNLGQHAYYDFSENTGLNAHDQWGLYDGTLATATTWTTGKVGSGVDFNGTSTSYVKLKDGVMEGLNDFTIATWVNSKTITNNTRIFDFGYDTASWMAFIPYYGGDKIRYKISYGGNSAEVMGTYTLPINQWVHLALVQSGDICKIYADGVEIASGTVTLKPSGLGKTTANYLIKSQWPGDPFLNASMDEFRIYNRAFDATEINGLMNATSLAVDNFSNTTAFDVVRAFPNPTSGQFDVILPTNEDSVTIGIYTLGTKLISKANYPVVDGKVHLNIDKEATGVYLIKIQSYPDKTIRIIKK